jgi:hypothetical protein
MSSLFLWLTNNMLGWFFHIFAAIQLHFVKNKKENYIIKSAQFYFYHWIFCVNKDQKPSGQNMGKW